MMLELVKSFYRSRFPTVLTASIILLTLLAWLNRFIQDDAFISFRYAEHLVNGQGLVWNPGDKVEGYTNFLWTLLMGIPIALGHDPVPFSYGLGLACFAISLYLSYLLSSAVLGSKALGLLTILLLGTNYTFSAYATGGLETQMQACLFVACTWTAVNAISSGRWKAGTMLLLSVLLSLALLTRPDSAIIAAVILPVVFFFIHREPMAAGRKTMLTAALIGPLVVVTGIWLLWKWGYYGDILPNTYHAKVSSAASAGRGVYYIGLFMVSYLLLPFPVLAVVSLVKSRWSFSPAAAILLPLVVLWMLYTVLVGGDFMEFRFMVPILPFLVMGVVWIIARTFSNALVRTALAVLVLAGSLHHYATFKDPTGVRYRGIEPIKQLSESVVDDVKGWAFIGKMLNETFQSAGDVTIATTAAGAIPYYSKLRTVDMLGLNDRWVARNGEVVGSVPGHMRMAPLGYLREKNVNLVIGHPRVVSGPEHYTLNSLYYFCPIREGDKVPYNAMILEIPLDRTHALSVLYLARDPRIDEIVRKNQWKVWPITELSS